MKKALIGLGGMLLVMGCIVFSRWQEKEAIRCALAYGRLADLPLAANNIKVDTEGSMFSRTFWLTFEADEQEINTWLAHSQSLASAKPAQLPKNMLLAEPPGWFNPNSIQRGEVFEIPQNKEALYGTVWIDRETHRVYIKTSHS